MRLREVWKRFVLWHTFVEALFLTVFLLACVGAALLGMLR